MSHVTVLQGIRFTDVAAIEAAVAELASKGVNISLGRNAKPRVHGADKAPTCEYVLKLPNGNYDVGLRKKTDEIGEYYEPVFDTWGGHVGRQIGASCPMPSEYERKAVHQMGQFGQAYQKHSAINQAAQDGLLFAGEEYNEETGEIALLFSDMS